MESKDGEWAGSACPERPALRDEFILFEGHSLYIRCYEYLGTAQRKQDALPIFLIHGLLLNPRSWCDHQVRRLQQFGPVYSISLPGHAPCTTPFRWDGPVDEAFIDRSLRAQIRHCVGDDARYLLLGHSTGALVAWVHAVRHPENVAGIISSSTTCHGRETSGQFFVYQTMVRRLGWIGKVGWWLVCRVNALNLRLHRFLLCDAAHDKDRLLAYPHFEEWLEGYFQYQKSLDARATGAWLRDLYDIDTLAHLSRITCPVLLIYGEYDPYVDPSAAEAFLSGLPDSLAITHRLIPEVGHLHMLESPAAFEDAVGHFIHSLPSEEG